jgi:hypothetical protein
VATVLARRALERLEHEAHLVVPPDEGRVQPPRRRGREFGDLVKAKRGQRRLLPFDHQWRHRCGVRAVPHELVGRLAKQDLTRCRVLLEPGGDVDGVADRERVGPRHVRGEHVAGVDADADLDRDAEAAIKVLVELYKGGAHPGSCPHGTNRIVLVRHRNAEERHHRVADELVNSAAVALDRRPHRLVVPGHQST